MVETAAEFINVIAGMTLVFCGLMSLLELLEDSDLIIIRPGSHGDDDEHKFDIAA